MSAGAARLEGTETSMHISRTAVVIAGLCVLAACGPKPGGNAAAGGAANSAAGGGGASTTASAGGDGGQTVDFSALPHPRGGLWQETLDDGDGKPSVTTSCLSGKTPVMKVPKDCSQFTFKKTLLGAYVMDMACTMDGGSMSAHAEMNGDFQNAMTSDMTMNINITGQPARVMKMHTDLKYLGPCAPGQTPDDDVVGGNATG
jgi:hypothetical protein